MTGTVWENSVLEDLIGKNIVEVRVGDDIVAFETVINEYEVGYKREWFVYQVWGDCCSTSWMSDLHNFSNLIGETVTHIEEPEQINTDTEDDRCRQESDSAYGYLICTAKGKAELDFRCSSNGYYGGWMKKLRKVDDALCYHLLEVKDNWKNE